MNQAQSAVFLIWLRFVEVGRLRIGAFEPRFRSMVPDLVIATLVTQAGALAAIPLRRLPDSQSGPIRKPRGV